MTTNQPPKPNPAWAYSPPKVGKDGLVWIDASQVTIGHEHYRLLGLIPGGGTTKKG